MSSLAELLLRADTLKAELDALRPLPRETEERVFQKFRLWWTYHSNAIEGNKLTQGETEMFLMEGLTAKGKSLKDHLDLRGHSEAIHYLLRFIRENEVLTEAALRELHRVLLVESYEVPALTPDGLPTRKRVELGRYKTQPNHVRTPTGETHFYASVENTPMRMQSLIEWQRAQAAQIHPVELAARFHHEFTAIHPFDDGNGRMARLLMNLLLMQAGFPPVVIRRPERDEYLLRLREADAGAMGRFIEFVAEHTVEALELFLRGARGEEIAEPTDVEKEIALLKLELSGRPQPEELTPEIQTRILEYCLDPLVAEIARVLSPLAELFERVYVRSEVVPVRGEWHTVRLPIAGLRSKALLKSGELIREIEATYCFEAFQKSAFAAFDVRSGMTFRFGSAGYEVRAINIGLDIEIKRTNSEILSRDDISDTAQKFCRFFVERIKRQSKTGAH